MVSNSLIESQLRGEALNSHKYVNGGLGPCSKSYCGMGSDHEVHQIDVEKPISIAEATHVYCDMCKQTQITIIEPLKKDDRNDYPWGDIVCGVCHVPVATLSKRD